MHGRRDQVIPGAGDGRGTTRVWARRLCLWLVAGGASVSGRAAADLELGCFFSRETGPDGYECTRAAGPVFERRREPAGREFLAVRPVYSRTAEAAGEHRVTDVLWPAVNIRETPDERLARVLLVYDHESERTAPVPRHRLWAPPFFFAGVSRTGRRYAAVFPLGGRIHDILGLDTVEFVLFPVYGHGRRRDVESHHVLWPVFFTTGGERVSGFGVRPFYSVRRGVTNSGVETRHETVMWPIWTSVRSSRGGGYMLFPFYGRVAEGDRRTLWVAPPFFKLHREPGRRELYAPWPLVQRSSGPDGSKFYLWPLWGRKTGAAGVSTFALWPIGLHCETRRGAERRERLDVTPVFSSETRVRPDETGLATWYRRVKVWPLCVYRREEDTAVFHVPELWPASATGPVERNLAPLWRLYSCRREGAAREDELLWGLIRRRRAADGAVSTSLFPLVSWTSAPENDGPAEVSVLGGLLRYREEGGRGRFRLFFRRDGAE